MHSHCSGTTEQAFTVLFMNNITNKRGKMSYAELAEISCWLAVIGSQHKCQLNRLFAYRFLFQLLFRFSMCLLRYQCTVRRTVISLEDLAFVSAVFFLVYSFSFPVWRKGSLHDQHTRNTRIQTSKTPTYVKKS